MERIEANPFSADFDEQLDACEMAFPEYCFQAYFNMDDVEEILDKYQGIYGSAVVERIKEVFYEQMRKYRYLFN